MDYKRKEKKMINVDLSNLKEDILKHKKEKTALFIKSFYSDTPSWEQLLNCFAKEAYANGSVIEKEMTKNNGESIIGSVVYRDREFYFNINLGNIDLKKYFPEIYDIFVKINTATSYGWGVSGLKIALLKYYVVPHSDSWDAYALQAQGVSEWTITSQDGLYKEVFIVEPGDFLFFPEDCLHEIKSVDPRSTFIFNGQLSSQ
jgi:hypothetical protein